MPGAGGAWPELREKAKKLVLGVHSALGLCLHCLGTRESWGAARAICQSAGARTPAWSLVSVDWSRGLDTDQSVVTGSASSVGDLNDRVRWEIIM